MTRGLLLLAALVALLAPAAARADADPASDYLYTQWVFLPYDTKIPTAQAAELRRLVAEARKEGYPIKVALIGSPTDLGGVSSLWKQPRQYARFLGSELVFLYKGRLLVVMPNGVGFAKGGRLDPKEAGALDGVEVGSGGAGLVKAALVGVRALAARGGHRLTVPAAPAPAVKRSSSNRDRAIIAAVVLAAGLGWAALLLRRRRAR